MNGSWKQPILGTIMSYQHPPMPVDIATENGFVRQSNPINNMFVSDQDVTKGLGIVVNVQWDTVCVFHTLLNMPLTKLGRNYLDTESSWQIWASLKLCFHVVCWEAFAK